MLKEERQSMILEIINLRNKIKSTELSEHLSVSEDTVRRDLRELAEGGFIKKVHGGALANPKTPEAVYRQNGTPSPEATLIAQKATTLLREGMVLLIDGGPVTLALIDQLPAELTLSIFTNSIAAADRMATLPNVHTYLLGGKVTGRNRLTSGIEVIRAIEELHADLCLINASSLHETIGLTSSNRDLAIVKKAMIASAARAAICCPSEHLGQIQPFKVAKTTGFSTLITDLMPEDAPLAGLISQELHIL
ncbi:MAG: DeoR/GlpR family DNA-binding transcription regulator [Phaeodactylibacter sp.]|uniref:DeoR/GlpR family DNA-binding transcription regulator n=1 Tax=Phaeodactylibacter sp. TaxID=1940289 RepID=UPI0032EC2ED8